MRPTTRYPTTLFVTILVSAALLSAAPAPATAQAGPPALIVLVRHAETVHDDSRDPALSDAGLQRAERLAVLLADAGFTRVHSSPYRRTLQTAGRVAAAVGEDVVEYDPRALPDVAASLMAQPGRHLVVGHSNTTPMLVELLGGDPGPPISEDEHGRIYVLVPGTDGMVTLVLHY